MIAPLRVANAGVNLAQPVNWSHPLSRGLVGWWLCLPGGGRKAFRWIDLCGRYPATLTSMAPGTAWAGPYGRAGGWGAVKFDGSNDFTTAGASVLSSSTPFTASFWRYSYNTTNFTGMCSKTNGTTWSQGFGFHQDHLVSGGIRFWVEGWSSNFTTSSAIGANAWQHLVGTWNGATVTLYVNGVQNGTPASYSGSMTASNAFLLGVNGTGPTFYSGLIDDAAVWNRALSADDIRQLYESSRRGHPALLNRVRRVRWKAGAAGASAGAWKLAGRRHSLAGMGGLTG